MKRLLALLAPVALIWFFSWFNYAIGLSFPFRWYEIALFLSEIVVSLLICFVWIAYFSNLLIARGAGRGSHDRSHQ